MLIEPLIGEDSSKTNPKKPLMCCMLLPKTEIIMVPMLLKDMKRGETKIRTDGPPFKSHGKEKTF